MLQLEKGGREFPARLSRDAPLLSGEDVLAFIDIDSTQERVCGHRKQERVCGHKKEGALFGRTKIHGESVLVRAPGDAARPRAVDGASGLRLRETEPESLPAQADYRSGR